MLEVYNVYHLVKTLIVSNNTVTSRIDKLKVKATTEITASSELTNQNPPVRVSQGRTNTLAWQTVNTYIVPVKARTIIQIAVTIISFKVFLPLRTIVQMTRSTAVGLTRASLTDGEITIESKCRLIACGTRQIETERASSLMLKKTAIEIHIRTLSCVRRAICVRL